MRPDRVGPYRISDTLGSGGMGTVYQAWDERLERWVAIKSLHPAAELSSDRRERLIREARAVASLSHPAVTAVHDILDEDGEIYVVMEYVEGSSLTRLLLDAPLPPADVLRIGRQIALGLQAAHDAGVVHRDLKAENVLITRRGQVKILDFGLAKRFDDPERDRPLTDDGVVMGTSRSMSPEQARGRELDPRSDLFALGSLLYEMLTGRHPFQAATPLETMDRVVHHRPTPIDRLRPAVPPGLARLVSRLLEKDRERRPGTALEVVAAMDALGHLDATATWEETPAAIPAQRHSSAVDRRVQRRRWGMRAAAALAVLAVVAGLVALGLREPPSVVIAVTRPDVEGVASSESPLGSMLRTSAVDALAGLERVHVVDPADVDAAGESPREAAAAVGADQVLATTIEAAGQELLVTLRCFAGSDATVLWTDGFTAAGDEPELLARAVAARVAAAYPERRRHDGSTTARISAADHQRYLQLAAAIDRPQPGLDEPTILSRLHTLRADNPDFLPLYLAEVRVACFLFDSTGTLSYLDQAEDAAAGARRAAPEDPRAWAATWRVALAEGDMEEAAAALDRLEAVDPTDPELPVRRARLAWRRDEPEEAVELLERAIRRRKTWRDLWDLAEIRLHTGDPARARGLLEEALELVPGHRIVRAKLAQLELLEGDPRRAVELERALLEEHPSATHATNLGTALLLLGEYETAREVFDEALEMAPDDPALVLNRADAEALLYGDDAAAVWYRRALEAAEGLEQATGRESLDIRAQCLAHLGRGLEAVEAVQRQLERTPDSAGAHFTAALVYAVIGDRTSAVVSAARSIRLGMQPRWFSLPFFASVRDDPAFQAALETPRPGHGGA